MTLCCPTKVADSAAPEPCRGPSAGFSQVRQGPRVRLTAGRCPLAEHQGGRRGSFTG